MRVFAVMLLLVASGSPAFAKIKFCNDFKYAIHIAVAYETSKGWISNGWTGVKPTPATRIPTIPTSRRFFYHAETDAIDTGDGDKTTWSWGNDRAFSVLNKPFKIENRIQGQGRALRRSPARSSSIHPSTVVTLTFIENTTTISNS